MAQPSIDPDRDGPLEAQHAAGGARRQGLECCIVNEGRTVPVIAFLSAGGGVGKTTLVEHTASVLTSKRVGTDILVVDLDVDSQALTQRWVSPIPVSALPHCMTVHDYVAARRSDLREALNVTGRVRRSRGEEGPSGQVWLLPSAGRDAAGVYSAAARSDFRDVLRILRDLIGRSVTRYDISCVLIDCPTALSHPYAAAAAQMANHAFLIARGEAGRHAAARLFPPRDEQYNGFRGPKLAVIVNQARAGEVIVSPEECLLRIPEMDIDWEAAQFQAESRVSSLILDQYVTEGLRSTVGVTHPQLVPVLEPRSCGWRTLIESPRRSVAVRLFGLAGLSGILAVVGLAGVVAGVVARAGKAAAQVAIRGMDSGAAHGAIPAVATRPPDMALWLMALGSALLVAGLVAASRYEVERAAVRNLEREGAAWLVKAWQRSPWYRRSLDRLRLRCASVERPVGA